MSDSLTLYEIEDGLRAAVDAWEGAREAVESVPAGDEEARQLALLRYDNTEAALKAYLAEEVRKVTGIASYIRYCDSMEELCDQEVKRLRERRESWASRRDRVKSFVLGVMQQFDVPKYEVATAVIRRQKNGGVVPAEIVDPVNVPSQYVRLTVQMTQADLEQLPMAVRMRCTIKEREFATAKIGAALAAGEAVPGARLGQRGEHLRIS